MQWYYWLTFASLAICLAGCIYHLIRLFKLGMPKDYSQKAGNTTSGVVYSYTKAMSPFSKESAYLNLPTYASGIIYHLGTFLAIALFFVFFFTTSIINEEITSLLAILMFFSAAFGIIILFKRLLDKKIKQLSNPDDYISNILVTGFQIATGIVLLLPETYPVYLLITSLLLIYMPIGKLKHAVYFFAARLHIGYFYGWRNVWPATKHK